MGAICHSSLAISLVFEIRSPIGLRLTNQFRLASQGAKGYRPMSASPALRYQSSPPCPSLLSEFWGLKLRPSCLCIKFFMDWATSPLFGRFLTRARMCKSIPEKGCVMVQQRYFHQTPQVEEPTFSNWTS